MPNKPTPSQPPRDEKPANADDESPLESLGKAVIEPVLGSDRTTTADRVRDKLGQDEGPAKPERPAGGG